MGQINFGCGAEVLARRFNSKRSWIYSTLHSLHCLVSFQVPQASYQRPMRKYGPAGTSVRFTASKGRIDYSKDSSYEDGIHPFLPFFCFASLAFFRMSWCLDTHFQEYGGATITASYGQHHSFEYEASIHNVVVKPGCLLPFPFSPSLIRLFPLPSEQLTSRASLEILRQGGPVIKSAINHRFESDTRNDPIYTFEGGKTTVKTELAGLGGFALDFLSLFESFTLS